MVAASYRQLAEIYHDLLSREELDQVLERLVKTVRHLIPVASILIAEAQTDERVMLPLVAEGGWPDGFLESKLPFGEGLIGLVVERGRAILCNDAHLDPRAGHVAGTPIGEPEAIISVPLVARGVVIGAMSLYREGDGSTFSSLDFELAQRFADAATIAIENARTRAELRELSRRDELTGLLNRRGFNELLAAALEESAEQARLTRPPRPRRLQERQRRARPSLRRRRARRGRARPQCRRRRRRPCLPPGRRRVRSHPRRPDDGRGRSRCRIASTRLSPARWSSSRSGEVRQSASIGFSGTDVITSPTIEDLMREADRAMYATKREREPVRLKLVADACA